MAVADPGDEALAWLSERLESAGQGGEIVWLTRRPVD
jgi:hypothetical protein